MRLQAMGGSYLSALTIFGMCAALWGQSASTSEVRGAVSWDGEAPASALCAELVIQGTVVNRASVMADGTFDLNGVPAGEYEIRIADTRETVMGRQFVSVHGYVDGLEFRLAAPDRQRPPSGTVTLHSLLHPPPEAAKRELVRAAYASEKGNREEVKRRLRKALAIFPDYTEAHNDLGVEYMREGAYAEAAGEFERAVALDPGAARPNTNLSLAWLMQGRLADAEQAARRAVAADPSFAQARQALELVLRRKPAEARE